jgi:hypothetical protein
VFRIIFEKELQSNSNASHRFLLAGKDHFFQERSYFSKRIKSKPVEVARRSLQALVNEGSLQRKESKLL